MFDADHAPARDFLKETVGFFAEDPRLFLVQTPHFFLNPDPLERNLRTFETHAVARTRCSTASSSAASTNGTPPSSAARRRVLSRKALNETGGFSGITITEDCETALELHSRGWNSIYVDKPLIAGLQPATFASFIGQRSRWAQGMMQILRFRFPLFKRGLTLPQRLCYMSSTLFWLFPFPRAIFLIAPLFYLFFDLEIFTASGGEFLAYTLSLHAREPDDAELPLRRLPLALDLRALRICPDRPPAAGRGLGDPQSAQADLQGHRQGRVDRRQPPVGDQHALLRHLRGAVGRRRHDRLPRLHRALQRRRHPGRRRLEPAQPGHGRLRALGVVSERGARTATRRVKVSRRCEFRIGDNWVAGTIEDVSVHGARIQLAAKDAAKLAVQQHASIRFTPYGTTEKGVLPVAVRNMEQDGQSISVGCSYEAIEASHHRLVADLVFANSAQWTQFQLSRRGNPGLVRGTVWFFGLALFQTYRGLVYLVRSLRGSQRPAADTRLATAR